ncbi:delta-60 repeat domain-containing protein [Bdellovibrio bacteriovorus]|uniref:delta-60 repeat domain-containing protein n=1 Tax=Bdellovibrio TaxID=958 RepID=UPI0035A94005
MSQYQYHRVVIVLFVLLTLNGCSLHNEIKDTIGGGSSEPDTSPPATTPSAPSGSFGAQGVVKTNFSLNVGPSNDGVQKMKIQSDGKYVVVGQTDGGGTNDFAIVRYNADGSLDTSFNSTGKVAMEFGSYSSDGANAVAIQTDGKILVAGYSEVTSSDFAIARYNSDGSLDTSFNSNGKVVTDIGSNSYDVAYGIAIQGDGKIIVIGHSNASGSDDFVIVRYNTDGSLDASFNSTGKVTTDIGTGTVDYAFSMAVQSDGKIILVGDTSASGSINFAVVRYNTDGSLDTSFNSTGKVITDISSGSYDVAHDVTLQGDGKIIVAGYSNISSNRDFTVVRYNTDGSLDTSFNSTGKVTTDIGSTSTDYGNAISLQSDGKIIVVGHSNAVGSNDFVVVRYNSDGSLDTSFNSTGKVSTDIGTGSSEWTKSVIVLGDGKILTAGSSSSSGSYDFTLARYNTNGSLDTSFNSTGKVSTDIGLSSVDDVLSITIQSDGKVVAVGQSGNTGAYDFAVARYNTDGTLDTSFNSTGKVTTDIGAGSNDSAYTVAIQSDGKIVVAGNSIAAGASDFTLVRYNSNGTLDTSFNSTGKVTTNISTFDFAYEMALQSDGKILIVGVTEVAGNIDFVVIRYNTDGSLDTSFNSTGKVTTDLSSGSDDYAYAVNIQSDGKILVGGYSTSAGPSDFALVRYNTDGSLDTSFNSTGKVITDSGTNSADVIDSLAIQSDGKIVVGGTSGASGTDDFALVRYNNDGSLDTSFNSTGKVFTDIGSGSWDYISDIAIQSDGKILATGYGDGSGSNDVVLVKYNANGSLDSGFGSAGKVVLDFGGISDYAKGLILQSDGKILVGGSTGLFLTDFLVIRFNSDGSR